MNYVSVVYAVVIVIILIDWFLRGKRSYRGQRARREEAEEQINQRASSTKQAD